MDEESQKSVDKKSLTLRKFLIDYSNNSSIHGMKYVFSGERNLFTKIFWAFIVLTAFTFSGFFLVNTFIKWQFDPDVGARKEFHNIRNIPFPAITICPQTKAKMEFLSFRNTYGKYWEHFRLYGLSDADVIRFESMLHVCDPELAFRLQLNDSKTFDGEGIVKTLEEISYSIDDSMMFCKFRDVLMNCTSLFRKVMTERGICYSFNQLSYDEMFNENVLHQDFDSYHHSETSTWSLDEGYEDDDLNAFPYPAISQHDDALRIILKTTDIDMDYVCQGSKQGWKVFFHLPGDFPAISGRHLFVPIKHDVTVAVTAKMTKVSDHFRRFSPRQRKCYLTDDRPLKFFKSYTRNACAHEYLSNYTLNACGCVKFSMPRDNSTKVCDYSKINCIVNARREMLLSYNNDMKCDCLPSCTEIDYQLDNFQTDFDYKRLFESYRYDLSDTPGVVMGRITIYFQEPQFEATERYPLFTLSDYIASCGGVLGLFMGFSILSFIELFYFILYWLTKPKLS